MARLEQLRAAPPVRVHAALVGLRRSGKSVLLEEFAARHLGDSIVAVVQADTAANAVATWMLHVVAALVGATTDPPAEVQPRVADIRLASVGLDPQIQREVGSLLGLLDERRQDNYLLFTGPFRLAQRIAEVKRREVILALDEFPEVLALKKVRGLNKLEAALRMIVEREAPLVFVVITGSAVRQMKQLLSGDSPLLTRFEQIRLRSFAPEDAEVLLARLLADRRRSLDPYARAELLDWVQGHPFYLARLVTRAAGLTRREIDQAHLHEAFQLEVIQPEGLIAQACAWIYERSLGPKGDDGRRLLRELAHAEGIARPADLNRRLKWPAYKLSKQIAALLKSELVAVQGEGETSYVSLTDPIFATWLAQRAGRVAPRQTETLAELRRAAAQLREQASSWYEAYAQLCLAGFDGKGWPAALFGLARKGEVTIPAFTIDQIEPRPTMHDARGIVHGHPSEIEADAYALDAEGWLVEVKAERNRATKTELEELERTARVFAEDGGRRIDRLWFVAQAGFRPEAEVYARRRGIYITKGSHLRELRRMQMERAQRRRGAAARAVPRS